MKRATKIKWIKANNWPVTLTNNTIRKMYILSFQINLTGRHLPLASFKTQAAADKFCQVMHLTIHTRSYLISTEGL